MKFLINYQNTRISGEDFAITPYVFAVVIRNYKVFGFGFCWGFMAISIAIGFKVPKHYPIFRNLTTELNKEK